jgi:hypothetical protein
VGLGGLPVGVLAGITRLPAGDHLLAAPACWGWMAWPGTVCRCGQSFAPAGQS